MIALTYNRDKEGAKELFQKILGWYKTRGVEVLTQTEQLSGKEDFLMVLGGDGTILASAKEQIESKVPILGVNLGRLGFLTSLEEDSLETYLERSLDKDSWSVEERLMLQVRVFREGLEVYQDHALNDVVLSRNQLAGMLGFQLEVSGVKVDEFFADGFIVATPTGSTAYSLSAGGPILTPRMEVIVLTPICAHTLYARPMVIDGGEEVCIRLSLGSRRDLLTLDGLNPLTITGDTEIYISSYGKKARTVRFHDRPFFQVLGEKIGKRK